MKLGGMILVLIGMAGSAFAGNPSPEIDASSAAAAVALISGGMMILRSRRRK